MLLTTRANSNQHGARKRPCEHAPKTLPPPPDPPTQDPACSPNTPSAFPSATILQHQHDRKSHPHDRGTDSHIRLPNPTLQAREVAQSRLDARSARESGESACTFGSVGIGRAGGCAAVVVTGGGVISGDHGGGGNVVGCRPGGYCSGRCSRGHCGRCCSRSGFGRRLRAGGARAVAGSEGVGDLELGGVVRLAASIVSCYRLLRVEE